MDKVKENKVDYNFDVSKIVSYLKEYKKDLPNLYTRKINIEKLVDLDVIDKIKLINLNKKTPYNREIDLKKIIENKLNLYKKDNKLKFNTLCQWIIKDWGRISSAKDKSNQDLIENFWINNENISFERIASSSKLYSFMDPKNYVIYDSRVAFSINWIIFIQNAGDFYFPIPSGRNSKMKAFDMNVLIRLKYINKYKTKKICDIHNNSDNNLKSIDDTIFIQKNKSYMELNDLIKKINSELWDDKRKKNLFFTEMLLFSIADSEVFNDIIEKIRLKNMT